MTHGSTWLKKTRGTRRMRLMAPVGLVLACVLLAGFAPTASAANYDIRGEWSIELTATKPGSPGFPGTMVISTMEVGGEFSTNGSFLGGLVSGPVSGTVSGNETSITVVVAGPSGTTTFIAPAAAIDAGKNELAGPGTYYTEGTAYETGAVTAKRLRSYQQIVEQEEREQKEREERQARENVRGEWALTLKVGPQTTKGTALIGEEANLKNEFASSLAMLEGVVPSTMVPSTFSGTLKGSEATVTMTTEKQGPIPASTFTSSTMAIASGASSLSMSGSGILTAGELEAPGELTATRIHTFAEVKAREAQEKQEKEAREAQEAKEAKEAEEARVKQAQEAREKLEKEAALKSTQTPVTTTPGGNNSATLVSAGPATKSFTVGNAGTLALVLTNPNAFPVQGRVTLVMASTSHAGKASAGKGTKIKKKEIFGTASFAISASRHQTLKIRLSRSARAELTRHKALRVTLTIVTNASGKSSVSKTYVLTLHTPTAHPGKG
jgi:hypothetical protein